MKFGDRVSFAGSYLSMYSVGAFLRGLLSRGAAEGGRGGDVKERSAGEEHGAAGETDSADHASLAIGVVEVKAALDEFVEIRRLDLLIAQGVDGVEALVVGK